MAEHNLTGFKGEELACEHLLGKGYEILAKNYRHRRAEVDIISKIGQLLVFVEVKTRTSKSHGFPEEAVNLKKGEMLMGAAEEYMFQTGWHGDIRFDVISITRYNNEWHIRHFEDAIH